MLRTLTLLSALAATIITPASAHSWIEEYQVIGPNGSYIGDRGFSRGYIGRTDPTFDGSFNSLNLLPPSNAVMPDGGVRLRVNATDNVCRDSQQFYNYTNPDYPPLKAAPGDYVAMKYLENGHVTLPWNQPGKPPHSGTVYVFGTTNPIRDEKLVEVMKWTKDGKGGNGRGQLLTTQNFDDGRCHQINECSNSVERQAVWPNTIPGQPGTHAELWCETDVKLPDDIKSGRYTTYWIWQWPTEPETECTYPEGKDEYYTTCADHEIIAPGANDEVKLADAPATNTLVMEDFTSYAVATYKERKAYTTHPVVQDNWASFKINAVSKVDQKVAAFQSSCTQAAATASVLPAGVVPPACPSGKWATGSMSAFYSSKGIASHKSAMAAQKAKATDGPAPSASDFAPAPSASAAAPSASAPSAAAPSAPAASAPAPAPTSEPAGGVSPSVVVTTVQSVYTSQYTSTITMSPNHQAPHGKPKPQPHQPSSESNSPDQSAPDNNNGYATVMTEAGPSASGQTVGANDLEPSHGLSTVSNNAAPTHNRGGDKVEAAAAAQEPDRLYKSIDVDISSPIPQPFDSDLTTTPPILAETTTTSTSRLETTTTVTPDAASHTHSSGCSHKASQTAPLKWVRTTSLSDKKGAHTNKHALKRKHAREFGA